MPPKSKKVQEKIISPKSSSPKNKTKRCPKGEQRNPKTGLCEKKIEKVEKMVEKQNPQKQIEMRDKPKNLSKMTMKEKDIYEKRKTCIDTYRKKLPSLIEELEESQEKLSEEEESPKSESPKSKTNFPKKLTPKSKSSPENTKSAPSKMNILQFHSKSKLLPKNSPLPPTAMRDLSNFSKHNVEYEGKVYPTVEHAFQAQKGGCLIKINKDKKSIEKIPLEKEKQEEFIEKVRALETAEQAKSAGGKGAMKTAGIAMDPVCWDSKRNNIMDALIRSKVERHEDIRNILDIVKQQNIQLVHFSRMDMEWGAHVNPNTNEITGKNKLGELYMSLL